MFYSKIKLKLSWTICHLRKTHLTLELLFFFFFTRVFLFFLSTFCYFFPLLSQYLYDKYTYLLMSLIPIKPILLVQNIHQLYQKLISLKKKNWLFTFSEMFHPNHIFHIQKDPYKTLFKRDEFNSTRINHFKTKKKKVLPGSTCG